MAYASRSGRARTDPRSPSAFAVCDRCGRWWNRVRLSWQYEWYGSTLQNTRMLVCPPCVDVPQENIRTIVFPADPLPITQPRIEPFLADETDYRVTAAPSLIDPVTGIPIPQGDTLVTLAGDNRTTQPLGPPRGVNNAVQNQFEGITYGPTLAVLSMFGDGFYTITITCSAPHGLSTNSQVSVHGASSHAADGAYSVTVTSALAFTYQTPNVIPQGGLLAGSTQVWTIKVGIPRGYDQIPSTGIGYPNVSPGSNSGEAIADSEFLLTGYDGQEITGYDGQTLTGVM